MYKLKERNLGNRFNIRQTCNLQYVTAYNHTQIHLLETKENEKKSKIKSKFSKIPIFLSTLI